MLGFDKSSVPMMRQSIGLSYQSAGRQAAARITRRSASLSALAARSFSTNPGLFSTLRFADELIRLRTLGLAKPRLIAALICSRTPGFAKPLLMAWR